MKTGIHAEGRMLWSYQKIGFVVHFLLFVIQLNNMEQSRVSGLLVLSKVLCCSLALVGQTSVWITSSRSNYLDVPMSVKEAFGSNLNRSLQQSSCSTHETYQIPLFGKPVFVLKYICEKKNQTFDIWVSVLSYFSLIYQVTRKTQVFFVNTGESQFISKLSEIPRRIIFSFLFLFLPLFLSLPHSHPAHTYTLEMYTNLQFLCLLVIFRE